MISLVVPGNSSKGELKKKKREKKTTTMVQVETKLSARSILVKQSGITQTVNTEVVTESRDKRYVAQRKIKISQDSVRSSEKCPVIR